MVRPLRPENWEELVTDYVLGHLSPNEAEAFEHLLNTDPDLAREASLLTNALNLMPHALPKVDPPPQLKAAILDAARAGEARTVGRATPSPRAREPRQGRLPIIWLSLGSAVAAGLLAVNLGMENQKLRQELQDSQAISSILQQPDTAIHTLKGVNVAASGRAAVALQDNQIVLAIQNLPEPPSGKIYRLWAVAGQTVTYCGQFATNENGETVTHLTLPPATPGIAGSELRITLEPANAPFVPEGTLVMQSAL
jgi:anti-sigma-K factor RskA